MFNRVSPGLVTNVARGDAFGEVIVYEQVSLSGSLSPGRRCVFPGGTPLGVREFDFSLWRVVELSVACIVNEIVG